VGDSRYRAGILAGCALSRTFGAWPAAIPGLGPMCGGQPYGRCVACPDVPGAEWSFVRYGDRPLCKTHARTLAAGADLEFVADALRRATATASEPEGTRGGQRMPAASDGPCDGQGGLITPTRPRVP
jgi:hypothetical protein